MVAAVSVACLKAMSKPAHKLTVWTWAVLTCFARVLHRRHYVSDVACGMLIGVAVAGGPGILKTVPEES